MGGLRFLEKTVKKRYEDHGLFKLDESLESHPKALYMEVNSVEF